MKKYRSSGLTEDCNSSDRKQRLIVPGNPPHNSNAEKFMHFEHWLNSQINSKLKLVVNGSNTRKQPTNSELTNDDFVGLGEEKGNDGAACGDPASQTSLTGRLRPIHTGDELAFAPNWEDESTHQPEATPNVWMPEGSRDCACIFPRVAWRFLFTNLNCSEEDSQNRQKNIRNWWRKKYYLRPIQNRSQATHLDLAVLLVLFIFALVPSWFSLFLPLKFSAFEALLFKAHGKNTKTGAKISKTRLECFTSSWHCAISRSNSKIMNLAHFSFKFFDFPENIKGKKSGFFLFFSLKIQQNITKSGDVSWEWHLRCHTWFPEKSENFHKRWESFLTTSLTLSQ